MIKKYIRFSYSERASNVIVFLFFLDVHAAALGKFPKLGAQIGQLPGLKEALEGLSAVFLSDIKLTNLSNSANGKQYAVDFKIRAANYVTSLRKQQYDAKVVDQIE